MRKHTKIIIFIVTVIFNVAFLYLCGYGSQVQPHTNSLIEPFFAVVAVVLLGMGEMSVIQQLYLWDKFRECKRRMFDRKLIRQSIALVSYYIIAICLVASVEYIYGTFYVAIAALALSAFWMTGSRTLWLEVDAGAIGQGDADSEEGKAFDEEMTESEKVIGYYLADLGKFYEVKNVMENDDVVEMVCQARGDRERTITIAKKKQKLAQ